MSRSVLGASCVDDGGGEDFPDIIHTIQQMHSKLTLADGYIPDCFIGHCHYLHWFEGRVRRTESTRRAPPMHRQTSNLIFPVHDGWSDVRAGKPITSKVKYWESLVTCSCVYTRSSVCTYPSSYCSLKPQTTAAMSPESLVNIHLSSMSVGLSPLPDYRPQRIVFTITIAKKHR